MEMKPGRNWYQVDWAAPNAGPWPDDEWINLFGDIPIVIDVLAMNGKQAKSIAQSCYPSLKFCLWVTAELKGCERDFQRGHEPAGEENLDLLPY